MKQITQILYFSVILLLSGNMMAQNVTKTIDDNTAGTLRVEMANAAAGDIITFDSSISGQAINLTQGEITIDAGIIQTLSINGNANGKTLINTNSGRLFNIFSSSAGTVNISDLEIRDGSALNGGAIHVAGETTILNISNTSFITNESTGTNSDQGGGAIFNNGANLNITNCSFESNQSNGALGNGGAIMNANGGTLEITSTNFTSNTANRAGGAIEDNSGVSGQVTITSSIFLNNRAMSAPGNGGAVHVTGAGDILINGSDFAQNIAENEGGALWNGSGTMNITGTIAAPTDIERNEARGDDAMIPGAAGGAGIFNDGGTVVISGKVTISNNLATGATSTGGGILSAGGTLNLTDTELQSNESNRAGGGVEINGGAILTMNNVSLIGNSAGVLTGPDAPGNGGGLHVTGNSTINVTDGLIFQNTAASEGGGLWNGSGTMTLNDVVIDENRASGATFSEGGGGIYAFSGGLLNVNDCTIVRNIADGASSSGGGILVDQNASLVVMDSRIVSNRSNRAGGGVEIVAGNQTATVSFSNVAIDDNNSGTAPAVGAPGNGGGLHITGNQNVEIVNSSISGNLAVLEGGGLWNDSGSMTISGTSIDSNFTSGDGIGNGGGGAGIFSNGGNLTLTDVDVTNNISGGLSGSGGGIFSVAGAINLTDVLLENNAANRAGGAIEVINGTLDILTSSLINNDVNGTAGTAAPGNGGAIHISGQTITNISESILNNNEAASEGGAVWNQTNSVMVISDSQLDGNIANGNDPDNGGGAIFNNGGDTQVYDSTISNNSAQGSNGGGISNESGSLIVEVSTISGNDAALNGGGIYHNGSTAAINAVTVGNNAAATNGGGITANDSGLTIKNSIVAENIAANNWDVNGSIVSNGFNLVEIDDSGAVSSQASDVIGTTASPAFASLGPLQDNGGGLETHAIMDGTRAQDIGDPADTFDDQRGEAVFGPARDAGAYEAQMTLSIDQIVSGLKEVRLYPNPSTGATFNLEIPSSVTGDLSYRIIDMSGKILNNGSLNSGLNNIQLNNVRNGIYIVNLEVSGESHSLRLVVE